MRFKKQYLCVCMFIVFALSACATTDQKVQLSYTALDTPRKERSAKIGLIPAVKIQVRKNDAGDWIVGAVNNANGVFQKELLSDRDVSAWVSDAVRLELMNAGYSVSALPAVSPSDWSIQPSGLEVSMQINRGTVSDTVKHELKLDTDVYHMGVLVKNFTVSAKNSNRMISADPQDVQRLFAESLRDAMQQLIPSVIELVESKK